MSNQLLERREELRVVIAGLKEELSDLNEQIQDTWLQQVRDALRADGKDLVRLQSWIIIKSLKLRFVRR